MFRGPGGGSSSGSKKNSPINQSKQTAENVNKSSVSNTSSSSFNSLTFEFSKFNIEVRRYALAAVILEEWLQELAAIGKKHTLKNYITSLTIIYCTCFKVPYQI